MPKTTYTHTVKCKKKAIATIRHASFGKSVGDLMYKPSLAGRDGNSRKLGAWLVIVYIGSDGHEYRHVVWADRNTPMQKMFDDAPETITRKPSS